jgi:hypothetical protein
MQYQFFIYLFLKFRFKCGRILGGYKGNFYGEEEEGGGKLIGLNGKWFVNQRGLEV